MWKCHRNSGIFICGNGHPIADEKRLPEMYKINVCGQNKRFRKLFIPLPSFSVFVEMPRAAGSLRKSFDGHWCLAVVTKTYCLLVISRYLSHGLELKTDSKGRPKRHMSVPSKLAVLVSCRLRYDIPLFCGGAGVP